MVDVNAACIAVQRKVETGENVQTVQGNISPFNTGKLNLFFLHNFNKYENILGFHWT